MDINIHRQKNDKIIEDRPKKGSGFSNLAKTKTKEFWDTHKNHYPPGSRSREDLRKAHMKEYSLFIRSNT